MKGKVSKTDVRPAMTYELKVADMKMLRFSLAATRMDRIRNESVPS